tara:strand:+ start:66119 stop:66727 length:609 start_codon:yes stop_codon:yes gene_type:complete
VDLRLGDVALPLDLPLNLPSGDVRLYSDAVPDADHLFQNLMTEVPWKHEQITLFGKLQAMPRLTCWMGDATYTYSGLTNVPASWSESVQRIREVAEKLSGTHFNGVLLNLYRDGRDSMGWHADDEAALGSAPIIASVSLGATRRFRFKPKPHHTAPTLGVDLAHASVFVMRGTTQENWLHAVPKSAKKLAPRINLTFRTVTF